MIVSKIASSIFNDLVSGQIGYHATLNISLEQLEDEVVEERLAVIRDYSLKNLIPIKDLAYSLNCLEVDCKSLDKCCNDKSYSKPVAHVEIPQIINDFGEESIIYFGSIDKQVKFKVYTNPDFFLYQKYKMYGKNKPYVYIDTTPNEHNAYDCYLFNTPLLERVSVTAIFKDPRQLLEYTCCDMQEMENMSFIDNEVKRRLTEKKLRYYRQAYPQVITPNNQVAQ